MKSLFTPKERAQRLFTENLDTGQPYRSVGELEDACRAAGYTDAEILETVDGPRRFAERFERVMAIQDHELGSRAMVKLLVEHYGPDGIKPLFQMMDEYLRPRLVEPQDQP